MAEAREDMDIPADLAGPLRRARAPVEVRWLEDTVMTLDDRVAPHRHDYHELIWVRSGSGSHSVDGERVDAGAGTITVIGRGQVHRFDEARGIDGAVVDFSEAALFEDAGVAPLGARAVPGWLVVAGTTPTVVVPPSRAPGLEALLRALDDEARRPPDERSADLQRHLLCALLLWIDRWHDDGSPREGGGEQRLHARFARLLERDFVRHHDAAHYADALAVPPGALARALQAATGRTTKELVLDRVMLEATRLLRFTDLAVGQVSHRCGYDDPLYFSRAFKRHEGRSPVAYRAAVRGAA